MCAYISVRLSIPWTHCIVDSRRRPAEKVLRSDIKRFNEELAAVDEGSQLDVVEKWQSLVREREKVGDHSVRCNLIDSFSLQFSDVMLKLERLAEKAKEDTRADIQKRRIEKWAVVIYSSPRDINLSSAGFGRDSPKKGGMKKSQPASQSTNQGL